MTTAEFTLSGIAYRAWYALNERETSRVLRLRTEGRPTRRQYVEAAAHARLLLEESEMTYESPHWTDHAACPVFKSEIDATGPAGNIYVILAAAVGLLRTIEVPPDRIERLQADVRGAASYDQAVAHVERWFPVRRDP